MERQRFVVALATVAVIGLTFVERASAQGPGFQGSPAGFGNGQRRNFRPARERWRQMSPDERQRIKSNAARWLQMAPEERLQMRMRRQRMRQAAEAALQDSGLHLEADKRELYERRYLQERRRIERSLRQELEEKRQHELAPVMENLKKEFAQPQSSASPTASTDSPKK